jgi:hypothetical protein
MRDFAGSVLFELLFLNYTVCFENHLKMIGCFFSADQKTSWDDLLTLAHRFGPEIAREAPFCVWVEWAEAELPLLPEGIRLGCARTQWASWIAARDGQGIVLEGQEAGAVAHVELGEIELRAETARRLHSLGLRNLGDLARLPEGRLIELFSEEGAYLERLAQGLDPQCAVPDPSAEGIVEEIELDRADEGGALFWEQIRAALERMIQQLEARGQGCRILEVELESDRQQRRIWVVRWNTPPDGCEQVWKSVVARLQREPWTFAPDRIQLRAIAFFQLRSQQLTWSQNEKRSHRHLASLMERGFLEGVMRLVWDDPEAAVPDERAHLEGFIDAQMSKSICQPRPVEVQGEGNEWLHRIKTASGWSSIVQLASHWEVAQRWWSKNPLWRHYWIACSDRLGPIRIFREPASGRWFRH